jgi:hypothetical protein
MRAGSAGCLDFIEQRKKVAFLIIGRDHDGK